DKGVGKGNMKYHPKVTFRALLSLACWGRGVKHFSGLIYNTEGVLGSKSQTPSYTENAKRKTLTTTQGPGRTRQQFPQAPSQPPAGFGSS
uniref:Uncharacterized protein n=1 Tax=Otus sunia TaxID=257818 RepID=A0A8C8AES0_9STRI